jgi:hypothetical protein
MKFNLLHILALLIACQSSIAVADIHPNNQDDLKYFQQTHASLISHSESHQQEQDDLSNEIFDCYDSCHCHCFTHHFLVNLGIDSDYNSISISFISQNFTLFNSRNISPDIRPPIA